MNHNQLKRELMGIVNQLFDLAEVPVTKRQAINDIAHDYMYAQIIRLMYEPESSSDIKPLRESFEKRNSKEPSNIPIPPPPPPPRAEKKIPLPPPPPPDRFLREGDEPPKPKNMKW
jgi:hypothetical protein